MSGINSISNNIPTMPKNCGMKGMHENVVAKPMQHQEHTKAGHNENVEKKNLPKAAERPGSFDLSI